MYRSSLKMKPPSTAFKPSWSPPSAASSLQAPFKPRILFQAPLKPSEGEAAFKPPWSLLEAALKLPWSLPTVKAPTSLLSSLLQASSKPSSMLQASSSLPAPKPRWSPFKTIETFRKVKPLQASWRILQKVLRWRWSPLRHWRVSWRPPEPSCNLLTHFVVIFCAHAVRTRSSGFDPFCSDTCLHVFNLYDATKTCFFFCIFVVNF